MSKRKQWDEFKNKMSRKRMGKKEGKDSIEYLTVQRLSPSVEGKAQKYTRIGPLTMVPFPHEDKTMENIKQACKDHFDIDEGYQCDVLAGERGPSYTSVNQIKNWKLIHIRFVENDTNLQKHRRSKETEFKRCNTPSATFSAKGFVDQSQVSNQSLPISNVNVPGGSNVVATSTFPRSVPLSQLIKIGKLIPPKKDIATLQLEEFDVESKSWKDKVEAVLSINVDKFASGGCRDAFLATGLKGLVGQFVVKRYRPDRVAELLECFHSLDAHTRKVVQMHALAQHFSLLLRDIPPVGFGETFLYTKLYYTVLKEEFVTVEPYIEGNFRKYVNTGDITLKDGSELAMKAESFVHYSFVKSGKQLMIVDLQGVDYMLCDPEIASSKLYDENNDIYFCAGNLSTNAIETFFEQHKCNKFCELLSLDKS